MYLLILQRLFLEALLDVLYFPLWWYTGGVWQAWGWCVALMKRGNRRLRPGLWLKNIFVPMFGQYDWQGKIISFFMRLVNVFGRTIALLVWLAICAALIVVWLLIPIIVVYGVINPLLSGI